MNQTKNWILSGEFLFNKKLAIILWFGLAIVAVTNEIFTQPLNNYLIFKYVYFHALEHANLYNEYPTLYQDCNHYGPFFSLVIAPFAILPDKIGVFLWVMANTGLLYYAIRKLPIASKYQNAVLILSAHEMMTSAAWLQINAMIAACIILSFHYINDNKNWKALFFIMFATFIKIYGIVGFAFFFFTPKKLNFILWALIWSALFLFAPALIASTSFVFQSYHDWYDSLTFKANKNIQLDPTNMLQDISVMGMLRRIFGWTTLKDIYIIPVAAFAFLCQYVHIKYYKDLRFRLYILCAVLIFTVIFSNGSENPTYIIAFPAVCIWFVIQPPAKWVNALFVFALILTSFSYSDIFTPFVREKIIKPYSLKALPCFVTWLVIIIQVYKKQFLKINLDKGLTIRKLKSA